MMQAATPPTTDELLRLVEEAVRSRLPSSWRTEVARETPIGDGGRRADLVITATAPDGMAVDIVVEAKPAAGWFDVAGAVAQLRRALVTSPSFGRARIGLVATPYLGPGQRRSLRDLGMSYVDATGNLSIRSDRPAIVIEGEGGNRNPWPKPSGLQSLKGSGTGSAIRALVDFVPPYGIRQLADLAGCSAPTLSRVADLLASEGLLMRGEGGGVASVDWVGTLRRWSRDYGVLTSNATRMWLDPRGLDNLLGGLSRTDLAYAVSGPAGVPPKLRIAPARLGIIYCAESGRLAAEFDLRPAEVGANVALLEPYDEVVLQRTVVRDGLVTVARSQLAVDLLTGPGRDPAQGEALVEWMKENEGAWRLRP